jgi:hypothetical protein
MLIQEYDPKLAETNAQLNSIIIKITDTFYNNLLKYSLIDKTGYPIKNQDFRFENIYKMIKISYLPLNKIYSIYTKHFNFKKIRVFFNEHDYIISPDEEKFVIAIFKDILVYSKHTEFKYEPKKLAYNMNSNFCLSLNYNGDTKNFILNIDQRLGRIEGDLTNIRIFDNFNAAKLYLELQN